MLHAARGNVEPGQDIAPGTVAVLPDIDPGIAELVLGSVQGTVGAAAGTLGPAPDIVVVVLGIAGTGPGRIPAGTQAALGTDAPQPCRLQGRGCRLFLPAGRWAPHSQLQSGPLPIDCHPLQEVGEREEGRWRSRRGRGAW